MKKKLRKNWALGFLSILSIRGFIGLFVGDWMQTAWILWIAWVIFFIPVEEN